MIPLNQLAKDSGLDIVKKLTSKAPDKSTLPVDVRRLLVKNENLTIEGEVNTRSQLESVRSMLQSVAVDRQVREMTPSLPPAAGRLIFAFSVKVSRK
jgi:hypothetical protein